MFLTDGSIEIDNNIAERSIRCIAVGRSNWLFAGSDNGGESAANIYSLIESAKVNGIEPWEYLKYILSVISDYKANRLAELLPWNVKLPISRGKSFGGGDLIPLEIRFMII